MNEDLDDRRWISQVIGYAAVAGVEWAVLTNGDEYRLYNAHAAVHVDEKLFRRVRISESGADVQETLELLSKQRLAENRLQVLWRAHFVDGRVRSALDDLFAAEGLDSLARLVAKRTADLTKREIQDSLGRCQVEFSFPVPEDAPPKRTNPTRKKGARKTGPTVPKKSSSVTIKDLIDAGLLSAGATLTRRFKGKELTAKVNANGTVTFGGETYNSPSTAGGAARATVIGRREGGKLPATNGWSFWRVLTEEGEVKLDDIRARHEGGESGPGLRLVEGN